MKRSAKTALKRQADAQLIPECAAKAAVKLGYPPTDVAPEHEGPDDNPQWCEDCGVLITLRSALDLDWGISPRGARPQPRFILAILKGATRSRLQRGAKSVLVTC